MLSSASGPSGGEPLTLWVTSRAAAWKGRSAARCSTRRHSAASRVAVNDGKWHQAVLTLSPSTSVTFTGAAGTPSQTATLYLDGKIARPPRHDRAGHRLGHRVHRRPRQRGSRQATSTRVDRRRVALHQRAVRAADVTAHYDALQNQVTVAVSRGDHSRGRPTWPRRR